EQVRGRLLQLGEEYGVDDFVILTITHDHADRVKSYQLLAEAFGLTANI
ncbi:MAG: LLM class flavin-dependent oxidoreductase, partial [Rhodobiaceae bacterium]|nr:LLM class flavin-dependent oxidoreductase [Rhodobiaceae bacterium]